MLQHVKMQGTSLKVLRWVSLKYSQVPLKRFFHLLYSKSSEDPTNMLKFDSNKCDHSHFITKRRNRTVSFDFIACSFATPMPLLRKQTHWVVIIKNRFLSLQKNGTVNYKISQILFIYSEVECNTELCGIIHLID